MEVLEAQIKALIEENKVLQAQVQRLTERSSTVFTPPTQSLGDIAGVTPKLPPFWVERPEYWFQRVEAQFNISGIKSERTKFDYVITQLDARLIEEVEDIILSPPDTEPYSKLKTDLIQRLSLSKSQRVRQLISDEELNGRKPSQFLRHLRSLAGSELKEENILKELWMRRLPSHIRAILTGHADLSLDKLAQLADGILETAPGTTLTNNNNVFSVDSNTPNQDTDARLRSLEQQIAALSTNRGSNERRGRSRQRSQSRSRASSPNDRRCLTTMDLTSLGVGSCVGTGMYLVAGMVARKFAGPGVVISFIIAALASIFSGACYAEFGVRVPHTTGSAYMYSYVTVGEFIAFIIGWNMILEYLIGSSACARALSACFDSLCDYAISRKLAEKLGTMYGKPPDLLACAITLMMMLVLVAGVRKSLFFNNLLNAINLSIWVFIMTAGLFYIDVSNWTEHKGFLPYGWSGVFSGAATCFYAFIGFDIIATTGEEANNPKRSIPLAIVNSLGIILMAYVSTSIILTLMVPYDQVDTDSALVQMFAHVNAPTCKYIVAIGALAGLTVSMFGSMFPMPRVVYAMALDGLIFKKLASISEGSGTPAFATICGGIAASIVALLIQLEVLVEMMSIGTLLAYTLVSTCVLVLRYQPHSTNLIELLPQSLRTPVDPEGTASANRETTFTAHASTHIMPPSQRVMVRRVTRSSPDSDDTLPGDESEEYRDDTFLVNSNNENNYYVGAGSSGSTSQCSRFFAAVSRQLHAMSYLCPGLFPWVDCGPATETSGMYVIKSVGVMYVLIIVFDLFAAYGNPGTCTFTNVSMALLLVAIFGILLIISRRPQNRLALIYTTPGLPFVPTIAIIVNIYLILNLSILTLVRFTVWMILGMFMYFKYGIKNSTLETNPPVPTPETPPAPNPLDRTTIPPPSPYQSRPTGDRNIFEGDGNEGLYGNMEYDNSLLTWHESNLQPVGSGFSTPSSESNRMQMQAQPSTSNASPFRQAETHFDPRTNRTTTVTSSISRPHWAYPDADPWT